MMNWESTCGRMAMQNMQNCCPIYALENWRTTTAAYCKREWWQLEQEHQWRLSVTTIAGWWTKANLHLYWCPGQVSAMKSTEQCWCGLELPFTYCQQLTLWTQLSTKIMKKVQTAYEKWWRCHENSWTRKTTATVCWLQGDAVKEQKRIDIGLVIGSIGIVTEFGSNNQGDIQTVNIKCDKIDKIIQIERDSA